jgi:hypothetical protein
MKTVRDKVLAEVHTYTYIMNDELKITFNHKFQEIFGILSSAQKLPTTGTPPKATIQNYQEN